MTIKQTIQKAEVIEIEVETPCYFKVPSYTGVNYYKVNSEDDIIRVEIFERYSGISRMPMKYHFEPDKIFEAEKITEQEFNESFSSAFALIGKMTEEPVMEAV